MENQRAEAIVNVRWDDKAQKAQFVYNDKVFSTAAPLVELLKSAKILGEKKIAQGQNPNFRLVIRGDRNAPALYISQAMNAGGQAGISDLSFSTVNKQ
jgi:biopolymer transport protein ExbD